VPGEASRMWALQAPTISVDAGALMYGLEGRVTIPLPSYLIEHRRGLVLFDTGLKWQAYDDPAAAYGPFVDHFVDLRLTPEMRLDRQLAALGYATRDVTHVILSHLHYDHCGSVDLFPEATVLVGRGELPYAYVPNPFDRALFRREELDSVSARGWLEVPGHDIDLFDDGSITVLWTPGHTPGELSLLVRLAHRAFLLTGDALHSRQQLDTEYGMSHDWNAAAAVESFRKIATIQHATGATVWVSHDPDDWAENLHAPASYD
jgi:N-acyl homoserine lactone hydrolase